MKPVRSTQDGTDRTPDRSGPYDLCAFCPDLCLDRCPVVEATGSSAFSPHAKMLSGWLWTKGLVSPSQDLARLAFQCTGCQACHEACEHGVDVASALMRLRAEWTEAGYSPYDPSLFRRDGVASAMELVRAQSQLIPRRYFVPEAQAVLFPGCRALLAPDDTEDGRVARSTEKVVRDVLAVFRALDIEFVGASEAAAVCCGYPLYAGGLRADFEEQARLVSSSLRRYRLVVTLSPCCAHTMRNLYLACGVENPPRVTTALEIAAPLILRRRGRPLSQKMVAYHDSCFLGRHLGLYAMPREVLTHVLGMPPMELRRAREEAPCCGAGGAWDRVALADACTAAHHVAALGRDAGADVLVTASVSCLSHLLHSATVDDRLGSPVEIEVADIFHLLASWLGVR